jgi:hypothetical protein
MHLIKKINKSIVMKTFRVEMDILDEIVYRTAYHEVKAESEEEARKKVIKYHREGREFEGDVTIEDFGDGEYECFNMDYFKKIVSGEEDYIYEDTIVIEEIPEDIDDQINELDDQMSELQSKINKLRREKSELQNLRR